MKGARLLTLGSGIAGFGFCSPGVVFAGQREATILVQVDNYADISRAIWRTAKSRRSILLAMCSGMRFHPHAVPMSSPIGFFLLPCSTDTNTRESSVW